MDTARIHFSNRDILLLFLPIAGELLLHYTVGIVDSIMVASVGEAAVSGVSLMDFVISFFNSLLTALAVGGTVVIGQYLGNADRPRAADAAVQMVLATLRPTCAAMPTCISESSRLRCLLWAFTAQARRFSAR